MMDIRNAQYKKYYYNLNIDLKLLKKPKPKK